MHTEHSVLPTEKPNCSATVPDSIRSALCSLYSLCTTTSVPVALPDWVIGCLIPLVRPKTVRLHDLLLSDRRNPCQEPRLSFLFWVERKRGSESVNPTTLPPPPPSSRLPFQSPAQRAPPPLPPSTQQFLTTQTHLPCSSYLASTFVSLRLYAVNLNSLPVGQFRNPVGSPSLTGFR